MNKPQNKQNAVAIEPKYEIAISFLAEDSAIAEAFYTELSKGLKVFLFSKRQKELAGTDGMESFRKTFRYESRLNLVLYRAGWGQDTWTRVEEQAIKDKCFIDGSRTVFIVKLDDSATPTWYSDTNIWLGFNAYGLTEAVGAIKMRVLEFGGHFTPMTAIKLAEIRAKEDRLLREKNGLLSGDGLLKVYKEIEVLFSSIRDLCEKITKDGHKQIEGGYRIEPTQPDASYCVATCDFHSIQLSWHQIYSDRVEPNALGIFEYQGRLNLPNQPFHTVHIQPLSPSRTTRFSPDLTPAHELGWIGEKDKKFRTSAVLADECIQNLLELSRKNRR